MKAKFGGGGGGGGCVCVGFDCVVFGCMKEISRLST